MVGRHGRLQHLISLLIAPICELDSLTRQENRCILYKQMQRFTVMTGVQQLN